MPKSESSKKPALIIFAKEPKPGKVKTRLLSHIPQNQVLNLYKTFIKEVLIVARTIKDFEKYLFYAGIGSSIPFLKKNSRGLHLKRQMGKDLGERMYRAINYCFKHGHNRVIVIGTDCLSLTRQDLHKALKSLNKHDYILGPSKDGGYYLLGTTCNSKEVFRGIRWSTDMVLMQTVHKIKKIKKTHKLLGHKEDIDTIKSLKRFVKSKNFSRLNIVNQKQLRKICESFI